MKNRSNHGDSTTYKDEERDFDISSVQQQSLINSLASSNFLSP